MMLASILLAAVSAFSDAQWIGTDACLNDWRKPVFPAPVFRRAFDLERPVEKGRLAVTGLGYFECRLDGRPVSDAMLVPAPTQYDVRWRYRVFELPRLEPGRHILSITAGDGMYRPSTRDTWHFDKATWMSYPKAICELRDGNGGLVLKTDDSWSWKYSPTVFTSFRGGETYDARLEFPEDELSGDGWKRVNIVAPPGGIGEEETFPPCRVTRTFPMTKVGGASVWTSPVTLTGLPRLTVKGARGAKVTLVCGEELTADGLHVDMTKIGYFIDVGEGPKTAQRDAYILKGGEASEVWMPCFTYHGFRYVEAVIEGAAEVLALEAAEITTDFPRQVRFTASDKRLERVAALCDQSLRSNFQGIPTDCPTREKNGWMMDGRTRCEATLYPYDSAAAFAAWCDLIGDAQRPSGQLPGMVPVSGWGYNWGGCPAWCSAYFEVPESIYRFTGDRAVIERNYAKMAKYLDYSAHMLDSEGVPVEGIGDWLSPLDEKTRLYHWPWRELALAFHCRNLRQGARFAKMLGRADDAARFAKLADESDAVFRSRFCDAAGVPVFDRSTLCAVALMYDLVSPAARQATAARLAEIVRRNRHRVDYGMIGSGYVLRALYENGYADDAYLVMTQGEKPGYVYFSDTLKLTAMPERWDIDEHPEYHESSYNHETITDYLACIYRYLGGFRHDPERPGRGYVVIRPCFPKGLDRFEAEYLGYRILWERKNAAIKVTISVPAGKKARLELAGTEEDLPPGNYAREVAVTTSGGRRENHFASRSNICKSRRKEATP